MGGQEGGRKARAARSAADTPGALNRCCMQALDALGDTILVLTPTGAVVYANAAARTSFGVAQRPFASPLPDTPAVRRHIARAAAGEERVFACSLQGAGGESFQAEVCVRRLGDEGSERVLCHVRDVSLLHRTAHRLRLTQAAVDTASEALACLDREGRIRWANPAAATLLRLPLPALLGKRVFDIAPSLQAENWKAGWDRLAERGSLRVETTWTPPDGETVPVELIATHLVFDGEAFAVVAGRDIRERKEAEAALFEARRAEMLGRVAAGLAHAFNNLLFVVTGHGELLARALAREGREDLLPSTEEIRAAGEAAGRLVRNVVALGRRQVLSPRAVDLAGIAEELLPAARGIAGCRIRIDWALRGRPRAIADPGALAEAILHIVENACDATPDGGTVRIEAAEFREGDRFWTKITISDTGEGMNGPTLERAAEPFFTTRDPALHRGLGLSVADGIIAQSGGRLALRSRPGEGTEVDILLPAAPPEEASAARPPRLAREGKPPVVLVAEDEEAVRKLVAAALREHGIEVVEAHDGADAWRKATAMDPPPDLLVTDVVMPGMRGPELAARLRRAHPSLPVLYLTGYGDQTNAEEELAKGVTGFLAKPCAVDAVVNWVQTALDRERGPR